MDTRVLHEVATVIREGSTEDRQALLVAVASALATCVGPGPPSHAAGAAGRSAASEDRLLAMPEVADQLGIPTDRAYDLGRQGRLPVVTIGKYRRVRQSAVADFLKTNETTGLNRPRYSYSPRKERRGRAANQ
jgi:excisionase family DNA binding protein